MLALFDFLIASTKRLDVLYRFELLIIVANDQQTVWVVLLDQTLHFKLFFIKFGSILMDFASIYFKYIFILSI